ncbi:hypothetical protein HPB50_027591 [Hyalomma asiaticum]|uniref:Uncharacterized protein n=1 Tax=Hyalomma asiaticum TaxID=266040 RepID=A0ACB7SZQ3_HYAAI|nr:hypothetical protein HPB50_027591 [Hyalomma asiaticum]
MRRVFARSAKDARWDSCCRRLPPCAAASASGSTSRTGDAAHPGNTRGLPAPAAHRRAPAPTSNPRPSTTTRGIRPADVARRRGVLGADVTDQSVALHAGP